MAAITETLSAFVEAIRDYLARKPIWLLPCAIVCVDLILIGLDYSRRWFEVLRWWPLRVSNDWSFGELYQYSKEIVIGVAFLFLFCNRKLGIYALWSALFFLFFADDAFYLHEIGGSIIARQLGFSPHFGLRAQDFGELAASAVLGLPFLAALMFSYRGADERARSLSNAMFVLIGALAFFGIFGDMLHSWVERGASLFALFEDGGEMLAMSALGTLVYLELIDAPWRRALACRSLAIDSLIAWIHPPTHRSARPARKEATDSHPKVTVSEMRDETPSSADVSPKNSFAGVWVIVVVGLVAVLMMLAYVL
jgi:hypothetical protein